jgi:hypothetical protein
MQVFLPQPPALPVATQDYQKSYQDQYSSVLRLYFTFLDGATRSLLTPASGTSANRPVLDLQIGQYYYDTTIDRPIWWNGTNWKTADGVTTIVVSLSGTAGRGLIGTVTP